MYLPRLASRGLEGQPQGFSPHAPASALHHGVVFIEVDVVILFGKAIHHASSSTI